MGYFRSLVFGKYLVITNTVSCGLMMGVGDLLQQRREQWKRRYLRENDEELQNVMNLDDGFTLRLRQCSTNNFIENTTQRPITLANTIDDDGGNDHDIIRTRNMTAIGLMQGPFHHYFYQVLDRFFPGKSVSSVIKKTLADQTVASPACLGIFYFGHEMLEQRNPLDMLDEIMDQLVKTYKVDCCFWPPAQLINFLFIPIHYRVIYINVMNVFYNVFLSYAKYDAE